jgi:hypothetical protein
LICQPSNPAFSATMDPFIADLLGAPTLTLRLAPDLCELGIFIAFEYLGTGVALDQNTVSLAVDHGFVLFGNLRFGQGFDRLAILARWRGRPCSLALALGLRGLEAAGLPAGSAGRLDRYRA